MKKMLKERFGLDWDTMSEDERREVMERFRGGRGSTESSGETSGR